jgi:hypothetical protein
MLCSSRVLLTAILTVVGSVTLRAQGETAADPMPLLGRVDARTYISPTGAFTVSIPVLPELGGSITDTENVVTFQDDFNTHISIAAFPQDATQRWEMSTRGLKDYLVYFFSNYVLGDFRQTFPETTIESAKFVPGAVDGSLVTYILLPGGSMFMDKIPMIAGGPVPVAKRGNQLFVKNGHIYVISIELTERVLERTTYKKTTTDEDEILRQRLNEVIVRLQFPKTAALAK